MSSRATKNARSSRVTRAFTSPERPTRVGSFVTQPNMDLLRRSLPLPNDYVRVTSYA